MMKSAGFTIMEVLLASLILSIIGILAYAALFSTFKTQKIIDERSDLQESGTVVLAKIKEDLSQTFHVASTQPKTQFIGEDIQSKDKITFTTLAHYPSTAEARESDQAAVTYQAEENAEMPGTLVLKRREEPYFWNVQTADNNDTKGFIAIAKGLTSFNLEYSDGQRFFPSWNIRSRDTLNKLPKLVKVSFTLKDETGREANFETVMDLAMSENLGLSSGTQQPGQQGSQGVPGPQGTPGSRQPGRTVE